MILQNHPPLESSIRAVDLIDESHREDETIMTATEMLKLMNRTPFESFEIHMNDGHQLRVEQPFQISTAPNSPCCTVYDSSAEMHIVSFRNITRVVTAAESSQSA